MAAWGFRRGCSPSKVEDDALFWLRSDRGESCYSVLIQAVTKLPIPRGGDADSTSQWRNDSHIITGRGGESLLRPFFGNCDPLHLLRHDSIPLSPLWENLPGLLIPSGEARFKGHTSCTYKVDKRKTAGSTEVLSSGLGAPRSPEPAEDATALGGRVWL